MHESVLPMWAIINESGVDKGLQRLGGTDTLIELHDLAVEVAKVTRKALEQREDWALIGIHR